MGCLTNSPGSVLISLTAGVLAGLAHSRGSLLWRSGLLRAGVPAAVRPGAAAAAVYLRAGARGSAGAAPGRQPRHRRGGSPCRHAQRATMLPLAEPAGERLEQRQWGMARTAAYTACMLASQSDRALRQAA